MILGTTATFSGSMPNNIGVGDVLQYDSGGLQLAVIHGRASDTVYMVKSASGGNPQGDVLNLAARHKDGRWVMVYLGDKASFSIHMDKFTAGTQAKASWIDPRSGESASAGIFPNSGVQAFSTPEGWDDALLILEPSGG